MKLCMCTEDVRNYYRKTLFQKGDICAATWVGSSWSMYHTVSINGFRYVDVREQGWRISEKMFENRFQEVDEV